MRHAPSDLLAALGRLPGCELSLLLMRRRVPRPLRRSLATVASAHGLRLDLTGAPSKAPTESLPHWAARRSRAADAVVARWPFGDTCLRRCLVQGHLLRELHPVLRVGPLQDEDGTLTAHAWIEVGGRVVGTPAPTTFTAGP